MSEIVPTPSGAMRTTGGGLRWKPLDPAQLGELLAPQYEVIELLGVGGMGAVYKGRQTRLNRIVAIKLLPPDIGDDPQFTARFEREAQSMAALSHPAIVPVYDFGETKDGSLYFVMEFVDGTDVQGMIKNQGKLPAEHALAITAHLCDALQYAHSHGVVHRDIKPANVLMNMEGQVKVADFGLAKRDSDGALTRSDVTMGTPDYIAPEALTIGMTVDHRADLYAVGAMLYNMLTGIVPRGMFDMPSVKVPGTDPRYDRIVTKAMRNDPAERYQSATEIRRDLDVILATPHIEASGESMAAIPKAVAKKPVGRGPQPRNDGVRFAAAQPALVVQAPPADGMSAVAPKKLPILPIGIGAAAVLVGGLVFLLNSGGKPKPAAPAEEPSAQVVENKAPTKNIEPPAKQAPKPSTKPSSVTPAGLAPISSTGWTDLLATADVARDAVFGDWKKTSDGLEINHDGKMKIFEFNQAPPEEYDFLVEFTSITGGALVSQMLVASGQQFAFQMRLKSRNVGCSLGPILDGKTPDGKDKNRSQEAMSPTAGIESGRKMRSLVEVRRGSIRVLLDDKEIINWSGDFKRLTLDPAYRPRDLTRLGIVSLNSETIFHKVMVRAVSPTKPTPSKPDVVETRSEPKKEEPKVALTPAVLAPINSAGWTDLLATADVARDTVDGKWVKRPEGLYVNRGGSIRIFDFHQTPPEEYDFFTEFTPSNSDGISDVSQMLVLPGQQIAFAMSAKEKGCFLGPLLDGKHASNSGRPKEVMSLTTGLEQGRRTRSLVEVRRGGIRVLMDDKEIINWSGDFKRLKLHPTYHPRDQTHLGISAQNVEVIFHQVMVRAVSPAKPEVKPMPTPVVTVPDAAPTAPAATPAAPDDPRLAQLEAGFKNRCEVDAQKPFDTAVAALNQSYIANGVARARAAAQAKGNLAEVKALDEVKVRIEQGQGVPPEDEPGTPESLKALRTIYRSSHAKIEAARVSKTASLYDIYLKALDGYVTELTKANKIDDAQRVKTFRDGVAAQKPLTEALSIGSAATPPSVPKTTTPKPAAVTTSGGNAREAAKWLLKVGASFQVSANNKEVDVKTEKDLPPGKLDIVELGYDLLGSTAPPSTDEEFQLLNSTKTLRRVNLRKTGITDVALTFLANNPNLTDLRLVDAGKFTDGVLAHLSGLKKLEHLELENAREVTGKGFAGSAWLASVKSCDFLASGLDDSALRALGTCSKLESIRITKGNYTDEGLRALTNARTIIKLTISGKNITDAGFTSLQNLTKLQVLNVERRDSGDEAASALAKVTSLVDLNVSSTKITDAGLAKLTALTSLRSLNLRETKVTDAGIAAFKKALPKCEVKN